MAVIDVPAGIRSIEWRLPRRAAFVVASGWTGSQWVGDLGMPLSGLVAKIEVAPGTTARGREWRAFFQRLQGPVNAFLLDPAMGAQEILPADSVLIAGAGQTGSTINIDGAPASLHALVRAGDIISIGWRAHVVTEDAGTNSSGQASISIEPPVTVAPDDNAAVLIRRPLVAFRALEPDFGWFGGLGGIDQPFGFTAIEVMP